MSVLGTMLLACVGHAARMFQGIQACTPRGLPPLNLESCLLGVEDQKPQFAALVGASALPYPPGIGQDLPRTTDPEGSLDLLMQYAKT